MNNESSAAYWCKECAERYEIPAARTVKCPECNEKLRRCSRYEWFLIDALEQALWVSRRTYRIVPQYEVADHRGFSWYWDLYVWVNGTGVHGGVGLLIDVNGPNHALQPKYSGPGGGYTRDYDKTWEIGQQRFHKRGIEHMIVLNDECRKAGGAVYATAGGIASWLIKMADCYA